MTTTRDAKGTYASVGAVRQTGGSLPIYVCNDCGRDVVWATSKKTGRNYLANVSTGYMGARYYVAANLHRCDRSRTPEALEAAEIEREIIAADLFAGQALVAAQADAWDVVIATENDFDANMKALEAYARAKEAVEAYWITCLDEQAIRREQGTLLESLTRKSSLEFLRRKNAD